jgi:hypothetical protein
VTFAQFLTLQEYSLFYLPFYSLLILCVYRKSWRRRKCSLLKYYGCCGRLESGSSSLLPNSASDYVLDVAAKRKKVRKVQEQYGREI